MGQQLCDLDRRYELHGKYNTENEGVQWVNLKDFRAEVIEMIKRQSIKYPQRPLGMIDHYHLRTAFDIDIHEYVLIQIGTPHYKCYIIILGKGVGILGGISEGRGTNVNMLLQLLPWILEACRPARQYRGSNESETRVHAETAEVPHPYCPTLLDIR